MHILIGEGLYSYRRGLRVASFNNSGQCEGLLMWNGQRRIVPRFFNLPSKYVLLVDAESGTIGCRSIMKLKTFLFLTAIVLSMNTYAQDLKIVVDKKGKVGFADTNGNVVIKCQYESAQQFSNGFAIVTKSKKQGIIDTTGNVVLPIKYKQILNWSDNLYLIKDGKKQGLADKQGNIVLPAKYSHISKPNCYGKALIARGGRATSYENKTYMAYASYGIIDNNGKIIIEPQYYGLYEFTLDNKGGTPYYEGYRLAYSCHYITDTLMTDCKYLGYSYNGYTTSGAGILDSNGNELVKLGLYGYVMAPQSDMVRYYTRNSKESVCGYHDIKTGKGFQVSKYDEFIDSIKVWSHGDFRGSIAPVNGKTWSFVDKTGKPVRTGYIEIKYSLSSGLWAAKNNSGKWEVFDENNSDVASLSNYEEIRFPTNKDDKQIFSVLKDGKYGCVDRNGNTVIPFDYEQALSNSSDYVPVKKDGKWGLLSADNSLIIPLEYEDLHIPSERNTEHFWVMKADSLFYHYNVKTNKLSDIGYKVVYNFKYGMAYVVPQGLAIEDTPVNRAQTYAPNTPKATLDAVDMSKMQGCYVNIINDKDEMVFDLPVSTMYKDKVRDILVKRGDKILSDSEKKDLILDITRENRTYDLNKVISENEWNY